MKRKLLKRIFNTFLILTIVLGMGGLSVSIDSHLGHDHGELEDAASILGLFAEEAYAGEEGINCDHCGGILYGDWICDGGDHCGENADTRQDCYEAWHCENCGDCLDNEDDKCEDCGKCFDNGCCDCDNRCENCGEKSNELCEGCWEKCSECAGDEICSDCGEYCKECIESVGYWCDTCKLGSSCKDYIRHISNNLLA